MNENIQDQLAKYLPIRMVVRLHENTIEGKIELSFSMGWNADRANVFWSGRSYSVLGEHDSDAVKWAGQNINKYDANEVMIDPLSEDSPIEVDWQSWLSASDKYNKRNAKFTVKHQGVWQLRSIVAESKLEELKAKYARSIQNLEETSHKLEQIKELLGGRY